jgi:hypothetical protein
VVVVAADVTSSTDLPAAADTLSRAADLIEKQPIGAFAEAAMRSPGKSLAAAMESAGRYLDGPDYDDHAHSMATHLSEFARRLLREEETP